jgi:predicted alpha/beta hydrolase family esterase
VLAFPAHSLAHTTGLHIFSQRKTVGHVAGLHIVACRKMAIAGEKERKQKKNSSQ